MPEKRQSASDSASKRAPAEGNPAPESPEQQSRGQGTRKLLSIFTNGLADERFARAESLLQNSTLSVNEKLSKIDGLMPLPATASAKQLGKLLGVTKQAVMKSEWWKIHRKGEKSSEIGRRHESHRARAEAREPERNKADDNS